MRVQTIIINTTLTYLDKISASVLHKNVWLVHSSNGSYRVIKIFNHFLPTDGVAVAVSAIIGHGHNCKYMPKGWPTQ